MKVSIIGQGYVGLTISVFAGEHHEVIGFDKNQGVVDALNAGKSHIEGVESADLARLITAGKYKATTDAAEIAGSAVIVIAVPTPLTKDRKPDLSFVEAACKTIGENLKTSALIINESTSFPGTVRNLIKPLIEKYSSGIEHMYAVSPERVDPGRSDWNQKNTARLYAGLTPEASAAVRDFYSTFCDDLVEVSSPEVAEAAKLFENTFRQVNIALVNEFAQIAHALGISVYETLDAAGGYLLPAFVDSHTHLVFAAAREQEFVQRIQGMSYQEIAQKGGGILNSARRLAACSEEELLEKAFERLQEVISYGTGAIEIKSGYGLSTESELKMLRVIRRLKEISPIPIKASFLGAHAMPLEYKENRSAYINLILEEMLPRIANEALADYIDVFCEKGFYSVEETDLILDAGTKYGLKPKIHCNQFNV
jgi:3-hydroxyisobutyrate dehydrogenase-like beta-hydroxyacid dehydrogenase